MIVRGIDLNGDWLFGKSKSDYKSANNAVAQSIQTRINSFLGDCFFATNFGIDWFGLLGSKNKTALELSIGSQILNTPNVKSLIQLSSVVDVNRLLTISYTVQTVFATSENPNAILTSATSHILTESGSVILTEDGSSLTY